MGSESLWGWFAFGVVASLASAAIILLGVGADSTGLVLAGVLLGVASGFATAVTTVAIGVQLGVSRADYLKARAAAR